MIRIVLKSVLVSLLVGCVLPALGQTITGPTSVSLGSTHEYTIISDHSGSNATWFISNNGVFQSQSQVGITYKVVISWNVAGTGIVSFHLGKTTLATLSVSIGSGGGGVSSKPDNPSTEFYIQRYCDYTVITRTSNPPSGIVWYWQKGSGRQSMELGFGAGITVEPGMEDSYSLQARHVIATEGDPNAWSWGVSASVEGYLLSASVVDAADPAPLCGASDLTLTATSANPEAMFHWYNGAVGGQPLLNQNGLVETTGTFLQHYTASTTVWVAAYTNSPCSESERVAIPVVVNPIPEAPLITGGGRFGPGDITIQVSDHVSGDKYLWNTPEAGADGPTIVVSEITESIHDYGTVVRYRTPSCTSEPTSIDLEVHTMPEISTSSNHIAMGANVTLSVGDYDSYVWLQNGQPLSTSQISGQYTNSITTDLPGRYSVVVTEDGAGSVESAEVLIGLQFRGVNENYIITENILVPNVTSLQEVEALSVAQRTQTIQYFDGLGRFKQVVTTQGSPTFKDVVQPVAYDEFGRESKKYLPYVATTSNGHYKTDALVDPATLQTDPLDRYRSGAQYRFYQGGDVVANDLFPYAETVYEASPLNRVLEQGAPGEAWQPGTGNTVKRAYRANAVEEVRLWSYIFPTGARPLGLIESSGYYLPNRLFKNVTTDEHGYDVIEYVDLEGRTVLKRVQAVEDPAGADAPAINDTNFASTYYIYNDFGSLVCVIQPEGVRRIGDYLSGTASEKEEFLQKWAFRYRYDGRRRMIIKQVPGADSVSMVYDDRDRLVLSQDGNQRTHDEWIFAKYDALNRPIGTGIFSSSKGAHILRNDVKTFYAQGGIYWEEFSTNGPVHGYSNQSFPDVSDATDFLTVTYYDDYDFVTTHAGPGAEYQAGDLSGQESSYFDRVKGQVTGTKSKVLDGDDAFLWIVNYYDDKYRLIQQTRKNHLGGLDRTTNVYDFVGKVVVTKTTHGDLQGEVVAVSERNEYDHGQRITRQFNTISTSSNRVVWKDLINVTETPDALIKSGTSEGYDAGARTRNYLGQGEDGWIEVTIESNYRVLVGLTTDDPNADYPGIDFAVYMSSEWDLHVYENGVYKAYADSYAAGDVIRVERIAGTVRYVKNNTVVYTSETQSNEGLFGDVSLFYPGDKITGARMSVGAEHLLASYQYNELGQLIDKRMGGKKDNYVQSIDYRYNIRGWLTSVNSPHLGLVTDVNDDVDDLFGMELSYDAVDASLGNTAMYNGNISAIKWKNAAEWSTPVEGRKAYVYDYDALNRLDDARYRAYSVSEGGWNDEVNGYNESLAYDYNGNILTLGRTRITEGSVPFSRAVEVIDDLEYVYPESAGNQLSQVIDHSGVERGFKDGATDGSEYSYDSNGNLELDLNKGIQSISYNHLNLPELITFSDGNTILYTYDANGVKLRQTVTEGGVTRTTDYVGGIVYEGIEDGDNELKFISLNDSRAVPTGDDYAYEFMLKDHLGNVRVLYGNPFEGQNLVRNSDCKTLEYYLDNQNVSRSLETIDGESYIRITSNQSTSTPGILAPAIEVKPGEKYTYKVRGFRANEERGVHLYVLSNDGNLLSPGAGLPYGRDNEDWVFNDFTIPDGVTWIRLGVLWVHTRGVAKGDEFYLNEVALFKHQDDDYFAGFEASDRVTEATAFDNYHVGRITSAGVYATSGSSSYVLTGSSQVANAIIGPAKNLKVYPGDVVRAEAYARFLGSQGGSTNIAGALAGALQAAFGLASGGATDVPFQAVDNLFGTGPLIGTAAFPSEDEYAPDAYLNYILFDESFVPYDFGYDQISADAVIPNAADRLSIVAKVTKPGYIYIYLSNESEVAQEVYFDNFAIKHVRGVAEQGNDYYPFGLTFNSYQRENSVDQRWKFQGQEHIDDLGLNWDSFKWRNHQPDIGRFFNVDPLAEKYYYNSPYAFSENKVVVHRELEGLESVYIFDQGERPQDNGTPGTTYTAEVYVVNDENGTVSGPYSGSTYPNSVSNTDNSTNHNTLNAGEHSYNNESGHKSGTRKGLNIVNADGVREAPGTSAEGGDVTMTVVNVHAGTSDNGNFNSRGSEGCITIAPADSEGFFGNFDWSGANGTTGNSSGTVSVHRGDTQESRLDKVKIELLNVTIDDLNSDGNYVGSN